MITNQSEYHTELIDGQEIAKPVPKRPHARVQSELMWTLRNQLQDKRGWEMLPELNLLCGPDRLVPEITIAGRGSKYLDGDLLSPAALAIEILSPGQTIGNLFARADRIVKGGTPLCVIIWPERKRVWTYTKDDVVEEPTRVITGIDGCDIDVPALWESLEHDK